MGALRLARLAGGAEGATGLTAGGCKRLSDRAAIAARVDHLIPACIEALQVASVEGEEFTAEVVAAITGREVSDTCDLLSREAGRRQGLVVAHTVRPVSKGMLAIYRFRHGLFGSYLHGRLDAVERVRLHGRVGR